jgi:hypothetical protein
MIKYLNYVSKVDIHWAATTTAHLGITFIKTYK